MIDSVMTSAVTVSNMEKSLDFYVGLLGLSVVSELPPPAERARWDAYHEQVCGIPGAVIRVVYLEAPDHSSHLELIEYLEPKNDSRHRSEVNGSGTVIIALGVMDSDTVVESLRAAGVEVLSEPVPYQSDDGVSSMTTYIRDPDGTLLCLFEVLSAPANE